MEGAGPMIFEEHQAIHLHIGKTAGVAVEQLLRPGVRDASVADHASLFGFDHERQVYLQHANAALVRELVGSRFETYYTFTVVRNPYARLLSAYYYLKPLHDQMFGSFEAFVMGLPGYLSVPHRHVGSHFIPQVRYTHIDGAPVCDDVVYFEHLPHSADVVRHRLGLTEPLQVHNRGPIRSGMPVAQHYTPAMERTVREVYAADFELLGYHPEVTRPDPLFERVPAGVTRRDRVMVEPIH